ncbi:MULTISPECIES: hypothetical protein [unclassified Novosphingobium]|uniref:hypothetical protein n=1 Tax=unclassified Novosphingobium TaxID=2644732 RepID=UPI0025F0C32D|nr:MULTISPECIES: hypothetical protein [unclassified Novosphingobium]HQV02172.1 hypothetical protein [Novosphingobium sp.]
MNFQSLRSLQLLDQVVGQFETGRTAEAVLLLAGMLDSAVTGPEAAEAWRRLLAGHPVSRFLGSSDPRLLADPDPQGISAWERQLHAAQSQLGFVRGLSTRRELGAKAVETAWQKGQQIALLECGELGELDRLRGLAVDNVTLVQRDRRRGEAIAARHAPPLRVLNPAEAQGLQFDLLLATADSLAAADLANQLSAYAGLLTPGASLLISAFVPGHLGAGWQAVCLGRELECHDETSLIAAARAAGLTISPYRDSSGSMIWAVLQSAASCRPTTGESTWTLR